MWVAYCKDKNATKHSGYNDKEAAAEHDEENILLLGRQPGSPYQLQGDVNSIVFGTFHQVRITLTGNGTDMR